MKDTKLMMGMPITVEIVSSLSPVVVKKTLDRSFEYFGYVDNKFSVYKEDSEISKITKLSALMLH